MSGKSLEAMTPAQQRAYQQGVDDTHQRYEAQQDQARLWLAATIDVIAYYEAHPAGMTELQRRAISLRLRNALGLDPSVRLRCGCDKHSKENPS